MKFNKLIKFLSLSLVLAFLIVGCEEDSATESKLPNDYVGLVKRYEPLNLKDGEVVSLEGTVIAAKAFNVDRVLELEVIYESNNNEVNDADVIPVTTANPNSFTIPTSVTIPAGEKQGTFQMSFTGSNIGSGKVIVVGIVQQVGVSTDITTAGSFGNPNFEILTSRLVVNLKALCELNPLRITIATDRYGSETTWELYDADLSLIASGGPYTDAGANGVYPQAPVDFCLPNGTYTFVAYDSYGDGMNSGAGEGYYQLQKMNSTGTAVVTEIAKNGTFGANDVVEFSFP